MQYFSADGGVVVGALVDASAPIGPHKIIKQIGKFKTKKKKSRPVAPIEWDDLDDPDPLTEPQQKEGRSQTPGRRVPGQLKASPVLQPASYIMHPQMHDGSETLTPIYGTGIPAPAKKFIPRTLDKRSGDHLGNSKPSPAKKKSNIK